MRQLYKKKQVKDFLAQVPRPSMELIFLLGSVEDPVNVGAIFRIADCTGAKRITLTGRTPQPPHPTIAGVGRGTHRSVKWDYYDRVDEAIESLKTEGFHICAIEIASEAVPYYRFCFPEKTCLVVGGEYHGVSRTVLSRSDSAVFIPMYGKTPSLNVHVSLAIVAFHALYQNIVGNCPN
jgi:23S rRNA (guanosine2251-2'-O)-methyltransferase